MQRVVTLVWLVCVGCGVRTSGPAEVGGVESLGAQQLYERGVGLARRGEWVRAEQFLAASVQAGMPRAQVLPTLLRVCVEAGRVRRALEHAQAALVGAPDQARLWLIVGTFQWAVGRLPEAERSLRQALAIVTCPAEGRYWLARVLISRGEVVAAREQLSSYLSAAPEGMLRDQAGWWLANTAPLRRGRGCSVGGPT